MDSVLRKNGGNLETFGGMAAAVEVAVNRFRNSFIMLWHLLTDTAEILDSHKIGGKGLIVIASVVDALATLGGV